MAVTVTLNRRMVDNTGTMFNPITSADAVYYTDDNTTVYDALQNLDANALIKEGGTLNEDVILGTGYDLYTNGESLATKISALEKQINDVSENNLSYIGDLEMYGDLTVNGDIEFIMEDYVSGDQLEYDSTYTFYKLSNGKVYFRDENYNIYICNNVYVYDESVYTLNEDGGNYVDADGKEYTVFLEVNYSDEEIIILKSLNSDGNVSVSTLSYTTTSLKNRLNDLEDQIASLDSILYKSDDDDCYYMRDGVSSFKIPDLYYLDSGEADENGTYYSVKEKISGITEELSGLKIDIYNGTDSNLDALERVYDFLDGCTTDSNLEDMIQNPDELNFGNVQITEYEPDGFKGMRISRTNGSDDSSDNNTFLTIYESNGNTDKTIELEDDVKLDFKLHKDIEIEDTGSKIDNYFVKFDKDSDKSSEDCIITFMSGEEYTNTTKEDNTIYYIYDETSTDQYYTSITNEDGTTE